jgi:hypothetical protein
MHLFSALYFALGSLAVTNAAHTNIMDHTSMAMGHTSTLDNPVHATGPDAQYFADQITIVTNYSGDLARIVENISLFNFIWSASVGSLCSRCGKFLCNFEGER